MPFSPDDVIAILRRNQPAFAPGEKVVYCDTNFILLGVILEKASGRAAAEVIEKEILDPLKLDHTSFPDTPAMPELVRARLLRRRGRQGTARGLHPLEPEPAVDGRCR